MSRIGGYVLAICLIGAAPAAGGTFLDDVLRAPPQVDGFLGNWIDTQPNDSGFARLAVSAAGPTHVRIHLFGRCEPVECDWGSAIGRNHSAAPNSDDVRSITAEFNTGSAHKRLTLRLAPGNTLRFEIVTDFNTPGEDHDFETSGTLTAASAGASSAPPEDCTAFDVGASYVAPVDRGWQIIDGGRKVLDFGSDKSAALAAFNAISYYNFDQLCFVARPNVKMLYWLSAGKIPQAPMPKADCIDVHPEAVKAGADGEDWKVMDGTASLIDYGGDRAGAELAASTIRTYRLNRECFVARPNTVMQYWLAAPG